MISKNFSKYIIFIAISLLSPITCIADGNYALNSVVTASGEISTQPVKNLVDGNVASSWNAGDLPVVWVEIDLGSAKEISEIRGIVDQFPAGTSTHNIYLDGVLSNTWEGSTKKGDILSWILPQPVSAQKIKIETTEVDSWVAWFEISVIGPDSTNPIPSTGPQSDFVTLFDNFDFNIPVLDFEDAEKQHSFFTANFQYIGMDSSDHLLWKLKDFAPVGNTAENGIPSFMFGASDLSMKLNRIQFGDVTYWADFIFIGDNGTAGDLVWLMTNAGIYD